MEFQCVRRLLVCALILCALSCLGVSAVSHANTPVGGLQPVNGFCAVWSPNCSGCYNMGFGWIHIGTNNLWACIQDNTGTKNCTTANFTCATVPNRPLYPTQNDCLNQQNSNGNAGPMNIIMPSTTAGSQACP